MDRNKYTRIKRGVIIAIGCWRFSVEPEPFGKCSRDYFLREQSRLLHCSTRRQPSRSRRCGAGRKPISPSRCGIGDSPHAVTPHWSSRHHLDPNKSILFSAIISYPHGDKRLLLLTPKRIKTSLVSIRSSSRLLLPRRLGTRTATPDRSYKTFEPSRPFYRYLLCIWARSIINTLCWVKNRNSIPARYMPNRTHLTPDLQPRSYRTGLDR